MNLGFIPMLSTELKDHGRRPEVIKTLADLMSLRLTQLGPIKHVRELQTPSMRAKTLVQPTLGGIVADQT